MSTGKGQFSGDTAEGIGWGWATRTTILLPTPSVEFSPLKNSPQIHKNDVHSLMMTDILGYIICNNELTEMLFKIISICITSLIHFTRG